MGNACSAGGQGQHGCCCVPPVVHPEEKRQAEEPNEAEGPRGVSWNVEPSVQSRSSSKAILVKCNDGKVIVSRASNDGDGRPASAADDSSEGVQRRSTFRVDTEGSQAFLNRPSRSRSARTSKSGTSTPRTSGRHLPHRITLLHFNDVYNIEARELEPCGGAARFVSKCREMEEQHGAMVLFSGDCLNPSLLSTITSGWQMAPVLNSLNIHTACLGNHDFDFGLENLQKFIGATNFPWLMANVLDASTNEPLVGAHRTRICMWNGVKVGLVGLVEREWLETLATVEMEEVVYLDFVEEGRRLATQLTEAGADIVIALTHMRQPNDHRLASEVPEIHLILGGHDHHYEAEPVGPYDTYVVKSGTDFRDLTLLTVDIPAAGINKASRRPTVQTERVSITSDIAEDEETAATVSSYMKKLGGAMDEVIGETATELDGRFQTIRTRESNLGNFVCDCWRIASGADLVILNSGTLRSDALHPVGKLRLRDLVSILPMLDETVVLEAPGKAVLAALENGVSKWPALEGRFPQVSGVSFDFDPERPPGSRVVKGSVFIKGEPLSSKRLYRLATKSYLAQGKDGFDVFQGLKMLVRADEGTLLPTTIKEHFRTLATLKHPEVIPAVTSGSVPGGLSKPQKALLEVYLNESMRGDGEAPTAVGRQNSSGSRRGNSTDVLILDESIDGGSQRAGSEGMKMVKSSSSADFHGSVISYDHQRALFTIQPSVTRRIVNIREEAVDGKTVELQAVVQG